MLLAARAYWVSARFDTKSFETNWGRIDTDVKSIRYKLKSIRYYLPSPKEVSFRYRNFARKLQAKQTHWPVLIPGSREVCSQKTTILV